MQETNSYAARIGTPSTWYVTRVEEMEVVMGISKLPTF